MVGVCLVDHVVAGCRLGVAIEPQLLVASWVPIQDVSMIRIYKFLLLMTTYLGFTLAGAAWPSFDLPGPYTSPRAHLALELLSRLKSTAAERRSAISDLVVM